MTPEESYELARALHLIRRARTSLEAQLPSTSPEMLDLYVSDLNLSTYLRKYGLDAGSSVEDAEKARESALRHARRTGAELNPRGNDTYFPFDDDD